MATTFAAIKFRFGSVVNATDGEAADVAYVVIQPGQRTVTHVGIKLPGNVMHAVPIDRVVDATTEATHIALTREAMLQVMQPAPADAVVLSRATQVNFGRARGPLSQISVDPATHAIRKMTIKQGPGGETIVPATWITDISDDGKLITAHAPAGTQPTPFRSDSDLTDDINKRLFNYPQMRIDLRAVRVRVVDGDVWLAGNVSSTLNRRIMSELLFDLQGLNEIHNDLVADNELAVTIARALSNDPRSHGQRFGVYPVLGHVFLRGLATTQAASEAATQIANATPGQLGVINEVAISTSNMIPMLAPVTGNEDIVPGGD